MINDYATNDIVMIYHADMYALPGLDVEINKHIKKGVVVSGTRIEPPLHPDGPEKILKDYGIEPEEFNELDLLRDYESFKRDTTTNGQGRMELSEIEITDDSVREINRSRIEVEDVDSYCEKNWMPVLTKPFHFVKWTDPTEIVNVDLETKLAERVCLKEKKYNTTYDIRGGSPLIDWFNNTYLCITHEVDFTLKNQNGHKNLL